MARWYAREMWADGAMDLAAGNKARADVCAIAERRGYRPLGLPVGGDAGRAGRGAAGRLAAHVRVWRRWLEATSRLSAGDVLLLQLPLVEHTLLLGSLVARLERSGVSCILLIHDLEAVRQGILGGVGAAARARVRAEEVWPLRRCSAVVAHNAAMASYLSSGLGVDPGRIVELGIFDYLAGGQQADARPDGPFVVTGNLRPHKARWTYGLPRGCGFELFGIDWGGTPRDDVRYRGALPPEELAGAVSGSFGVVWDGESCDTCSGVYGEYLRVNNPHKASFYLSAGLPVAIWDQAALAGLVCGSGAGVSVASLDELAGLRSGMDEDDYAAMRDAAAALGGRLRAGAFTDSALERAERLCGGGQ